MTAVVADLGMEVPQMKRDVALILAIARSMLQRVRRIDIGIFTTLAIFSCLSQALAADEERFEIISIQAIRPTLVDTITALQQRDVVQAKAAFEAYDSGWNGIEVYINTRSKDMYQLLELEFQPRITKALDGPNPDIPALLTDAQAMLAKFDEAVAMFGKAPPLNPLYDDVARLRIVRAHLREVPPALKAGNIAKARKSFEAFEDTWFNIEDSVRARSLDAYVAIETGMVQIEQALLMPDKPDPAAVTALVDGVMRQYNAVVAEVQKEARARQ
jgi:tetratricopeptide (TPR) repeat protein